MSETPVPDIELKCHPTDFDDIYHARKQFEVRKDDRTFEVGRILSLREYVPHEVTASGTSILQDLGTYTGRSCRVIVTYILRDSPFLSPGVVVMGFFPPLGALLRMAVTGRAMTPPKISGHAEDLRELMGDLSRHYWSATWLVDLEYILWGVATGDRTWSPRDVTDDEAQRLGWLANECGGWWSWARGEGGARFVPMGEWLTMYEAWKARLATAKEKSS